jgi:hypothetical protein
MVGAGSKIFLNSSLAFAYIGQTLAALGQPLILNATGKVASSWFREDRVKNIIYLESHSYIRMCCCQYYWSNLWLCTKYLLS